MNNLINDPAYQKTIVTLKQELFKLATEFKDVEALKMIQN
jgi:hypothetical protein